MRLLFRIGDDVQPVELAREADGRWRVSAAGTTVLLRRAAGDPHAAQPLLVEVDGRPTQAVVAQDGRRWWVALGGEVLCLVEAEEDAPGRAGRESDRVSGALLAPIPGRVARLLVAEGDAVERGQTVATIEAMKMETALRAERDGRVSRLLVAPGDRVEPGQVIAEIEVEAPA